MNEEDRSTQKVLNTKSYNQEQAKTILRPNSFRKLNIWLRYFTITFVIISLIYGSVKWGLVETFVVKGNSMLPTFADLDYLQADKTFFLLMG